MIVIKVLVECTQQLKNVSYVYSLVYHVTVQVHVILVQET